MAQSFTKKLLSGSTNGKSIKLTGTNSAGHVLIHTAVAGTSELDEIFLFVNNTDATVSRTVTFEFG